MAGALVGRKIMATGRYVGGVRGTILGVLITFDDQPNLLLRDATKIYYPRQRRGETNADDLSQSNLEVEVARRSSGNGKSRHFR